MNQILWKPQHIEETKMWQFMQFVNRQYGINLVDYESLHAWSIEHLADFWQSIVSFFNVSFDTPPTHILNSYTHMIYASWFQGAHLNIAKMLLSREDDHPALICINEQNDREEISYSALKQRVAECAAGLKAAGVKKGDHVAAILPNVSFTVVAFLATASIGAVWSSCSPDFGLQAAYDRLSQVDPVILFASNGHKYHDKVHNDLEKACQLNQMIPSVKKLVICPTVAGDTPLLAENMMLWQTFLKPADTLDYVSLPFSHPLYIMFSSGTTGKPKCIVHQAGGVLLQHLKELGLHTDLKAEDNLLFYTTCGWMMWNWMISALALGTTLTLYEGCPTAPDPYHLMEILENEKVTVFGTSAKYLANIDKQGLRPISKYQLKHLRTILTTGSPLLPKHFDYIYEAIKHNIQCSSISGGTDIVSCFALGNPILPVRRGELQCLGLGMAVEVFDEQGNSIKNSRGELVCTKPFVSMPLGFLNDPDNSRYKQAYFTRFPGVWAHGDFAQITPNLGLIIYGRSDAVLNPGGVRIGTAEIYRQVAKVPEVVDSVVIGQAWEDGDERLILFVQLQPDLTLTAEIQTNIRHILRHNASPRHVPAIILQVSDIPRTMNGKVVELAVRAIINGQPIHNQESLANPQALNAFKKYRRMLQGN